MEGEPVMNQTIGQVAEKMGVSAQTLRRWEAAGLIPPAKRRFIARWRTWTDSDVEKIERVLKDHSK